MKDKIKSTCCLWDFWTLPKILNENEKILYLSLGAGNTGKDFDLETTERIAEYKFVNWTGKSDTNSI